jgi:hypothetical protein
MVCFDTEKDIFEFFRDFYGHYFPKPTSSVSFVRHGANLWKVKKRLFEHIAEKFRDLVTVIDSLNSTMSICLLDEARIEYGQTILVETFY